MISLNIVTNVIENNKTQKMDYYLISGYMGRTLREKTFNDRTNDLENQNLTIPGGKVQEVKSIAKSSR